MKKIFLTLLILSASELSHAQSVSDIFGKIGSVAKSKSVCTGTYRVIDSGPFGQDVSTKSDRYKGRNLPDACARAKADTYHDSGPFGVDSRTLVSLSCTLKGFPVPVDIYTCRPKL